MERLTPEGSRALHTAEKTADFSLNNPKDYSIDTGTYHGSIKPGEMTGSQAKNVEQRLQGSELADVGLTDQIKNIPQIKPSDVVEKEQINRADAMLKGTPLENATLVPTKSDSWKDPVPQREVEEPRKSWLKRLFGG